MENISNKLVQYAYKIDDILILNNNKTILEPSSDDVQSFLITHDYINNVSPAMNLTLRVKRTDYFTLLKSSGDTYISFNLYRFYLGKNTGASDNLQDSIEEAQFVKIASYTAKAINEDNLNTLVGSYLTEENDIDTESYLNDSFSNFVNITFYLYDYQNLKKYKIPKSYIIKGALNDCIYRFFKDRGLTNILCDTISSNSSKIYSIHYGNLGDNLKALNNYYGLYDSPYIFYMDYNKIYLFGSASIGSLLANDEDYGTVSIYLEDYKPDTAMKTGSIKYDEKSTYALMASQISIKDADDSIDYAIGGSVTTINRQTGKRKHTVFADANEENEAFYSVNSDKHHGQIVWNIQKNKRKVSLTFSDLDALIITPNKVFSIIPNGSTYDSSFKLNASYQMDSSVFNYRREGEESLRLSVQINLSQITPIKEEYEASMKSGYLQNLSK